jgi:hypothetical protein
MIDFNKLIDDYLEREISYKRIGKYYPSEIGTCLRKTWYSYKSPKKIDSKASKAFYCGDFIHELIEEVLASNKTEEIRLLDSEVPIKYREQDFVIVGRIDSLILAGLDHKKILLEVKSCKFLPDKFKEEHEMQLQFYLHSLNLTEGILLYIRKDDLQTKPFEISYNEEKALSIIKRFENLHLALIYDKIPEPEARLDKNKEWVCENCLWKEECFNS